jgi:hypothetical protein
MVLKTELHDRAFDMRTYSGDVAASNSPEDVQILLYPAHRTTGRR